MPRNLENSTVLVPDRFDLFLSTLSQGQLNTLEQIVDVLINEDEKGEVAQLTERFEMEALILWGRAGETQRRNDSIGYKEWKAELKKKIQDYKKPTTEV